ncbi:hypothetical protein JCM19239_7183 [Vibrio variabilis]|uniref:Uncharacterized protein n=1 Tax=Vibrio variabilis TaxID=990271 RepID=A0ABQ0JLB6_9VIBR|nr:hypothetical protein JCM19239_7183 [Vibrio variabilis]
MNFKRSFLFLSTLTLPTFAFSHGNVDISNGSHIEVYFADEQHHGHSDNDTERVYGIEGVWMHDSGVFVYGEAETGAMSFTNWVGVSTLTQLTILVGSLMARMLKEVILIAMNFAHVLVLTIK